VKEAILLIRFQLNQIRKPTST